MIQVERTCLSIHPKYGLTSESYMCDKYVEPRFSRVESRVKEHRSVLRNVIKLLLVGPDVAANT